PAKGRISGVYGSQRFFNGKPRNPHYGLDIANKTGTPVWAPLRGIVTFAEDDLYYSGGTVIIDHGYGISSTYIHLDKIHVN
ncbi:peptidase, partial [Pseudoalteromonas ruthenica]